MTNLAIIIPAYNMRSRYSNDQEFLEVLQHYEDQAQKNSVQLHMVDDGSMDRSQELMRGFQHSASTYHFLPQNLKKIGAIKHVLACLDDTIEYVLHTDFDCRFREDTIQHALSRISELESTPKLGGFCLRVVPAQSKNLLEAFQEWEYAHGRWSTILTRYEGKVRCVGGAGGLWKRRVYEEQLERHSGMFISEDMEQTALIMEAGYQVRYAADVEITTRTPRTLKQLLRQRIRWAKGAMYAYHNADGFYKKQALRFIPRKSVHGALSAFQMYKLATTPCWMVYTGVKIAEGNWLAGAYTYGIGLAASTLLSVLAQKEFDNKTKCFGIVPLAPILEYGLYLSAHAVAWKEFLQERTKARLGKSQEVESWHLTPDTKEEFATISEPAGSSVLAN